MSLDEWKKTRWRTQGPKCVFCDLTTEPAIVFRGEEYTVKGWRCPKCGFSFIHPEEISKALELLKEVTKSM